MQNFLNEKKITGPSKEKLRVRALLAKLSTSTGHSGIALKTSICELKLLDSNKLIANKERGLS